MELIINKFVTDDYCPKLALDPMAKVYLIIQTFKKDKFPVYILYTRFKEQLFMRLQKLLVTTFVVTYIDFF